MKKKKRHKDNIVSMNMRITHINLGLLYSSLVYNRKKRQYHKKYIYFLEGNHRKKKKKTMQSNTSNYQMF